MRPAELMAVSAGIKTVATDAIRSPTYVDHSQQVEIVSRGSLSLSESRQGCRISVLADDAG
jgi:hypothetical protein